MKLSIIIPYYKTLDLTRTLLNTLTEQLTREVEIILVDDGCDQKEFDLIEGVNVIHTINRGVSSARNTGIENAKGENIVFIDSDDDVSKDYVEKILQKIDNSTFDYCLFSWESKDKFGKIIIVNDPPQWNTCVWNCIYKKKTIGDNRFSTSLTISEDEDFNTRVRKGKRENIKDILYYYNTNREDSLTKQFSKGLISKNLPERASLLIYQKALGHIGGLETWCNEFTEMYKDDYDITFVYSFADRAQLNRLREKVRCIKYNGQHFICDKYICASNQANIADNVESRDNFYAIIIQADYDAMKWKYRKHPKTNVHIAVSEVAKRGVRNQIPEEEVKVIYNVLNKKKVNRVLRLVSATRLSWEKGGARYEKFARKLNELNIPFVWQIFTDDLAKSNIDGVVYRKGSYDITDYIADADYLIGLSDTESFGYSVYEAFNLGIPVISTNYPAIYELGIKENVNGYLVDMELSNIEEVIIKMYNNNLKGFKYNKIDKKEDWEKILGNIKHKSDYVYIKKEEILAEVIIPCYYTQENVTAKKGEIIEIASEERLKFLVDSKYVKKIK